MSTYLKEKYGPVAGIYAGMTPFIFITDYNIIKELFKVKPGNTKGESITVPLTSCLTVLD
jgi:hypothetical protein